MAKEYIEREALLSAFGEEPMVWDERDDAEVQERFDWRRYTDIVKEQPAADVVEVVHAEWIDIRFDPMWRSMLATCSHCKVRGEVRVKRNECGFAVPDSNHCPNCGERMDGE